MTNKTGSETAAIQVLTRAVQLDAEKKFSEALTCYEQGIRLLLQACNECSSDEKKCHFQKKIKEYLTRAEVMKTAARRLSNASQNHKQIKIESGATGHSYEQVFGYLIDDSLSHVHVEDAYIISTHQVYNFLLFCELCVRRSKHLKSITLCTTVDKSNPRLQNERLQEIGQSLAKYGINLHLQFSDTIHDREIRLDNGWIIKIGRGLDYFQKPDGRFSIGWSDYALRKCHETTIDIFPSGSLKT